MPQRTVATARPVPLPSAEEIARVVADAASEPDASARTIAEAIEAFVTARLTGGHECRHSGCPYYAVPGLDACAEHVADELASLRRSLRDGC